MEMTAENVWVEMTRKTPTSTYLRSASLLQQGYALNPF